MAGKLLTGVAASAGGFIGLVFGSAIAQAYSKNAATADTKTATLVLGGLSGMLLGTFTGAALTAEDASPGASGVAGLPKGLGAAPVDMNPSRYDPKRFAGREPPHKCTAASATQIAQQIPGAPWAYSQSFAANSALPWPMVEREYNVTTPMGAKRVPALFTLDKSRMSLTCPFTGQRFVFVRGR